MYQESEPDSVDPTPEIDHGTIELNKSLDGR